MSTKPLTLNIKRRSVSRIRQHRYLGMSFNYPICVFLLVLGLPFMFLNIGLALIQRKALFVTWKEQDCLGRTVKCQRFSIGIFKTIPMLWAVLTKRISLCGMPIGVKLTKTQKSRCKFYSFIPPGLFDAITLHQASGLAAIDKSMLLEQQFSSGRLAYLFLLCKASVAKFLYCNNKVKLNSPSIFNVFGLRINNDTMTDAIDWVLSEHESSVCKTGCFINVNSVNLTARHANLRECINASDRSFADGSGVRLAAKTLGISIKDNVNGTDMLPLLCDAAQRKGVSIFFLGAKPGVAMAAANNLSNQYPQLNIAGAEHGYFGRDEDSEVIKRINQSKADIVLLAMGSPIQEKWLRDNATKLTCRTALAVGGLFDFYSGQVSRAPMWMRELGLEWIWRLMQEPKSKFSRYVIGNPLFLIRTFILNAASRGL